MLSLARDLCIPCVAKQCPSINYGKVGSVRTLRADSCANGVGYISSVRKGVHMPKIKYINRRHSVLLQNIIVRSHNDIST